MKSKEVFINPKNIINMARQVQELWGEIKQNAVEYINNLCESSRGIEKLKNIFSAEKIQDLSLLQLIRLETLFVAVIADLTQVDDESLKAIEDIKESLNAIGVIKKSLSANKPVKIKEVKNKLFSQALKVQVDEDIQGYFLEILKKI